MTPPEYTAHPADSTACKAQGDACLDAGKFQEATQYYRQAIALNPRFAEVWNNLGITCREQNLFEDAEHHFKQAIEIKPDLANAYYNLASLFREQGRLYEAIKHLNMTITHAHEHYAALAIMLNLLQKICMWDDLDLHTGTLQHAVLTLPASPINVFSPFVFVSLPGTTAEEQKRCAEHWAKVEYGHYVSFQDKLSFDRIRPTEKRLHVAYLSADFFDHATSRLMAQVFELHDRDRFHITAYSYGPSDGSPMHKRLVDAFDNFVDIRNLDFRNAAKKIFEDDIDILVDLKGYTQDTRSGILALRPAPIQVNFLGYPGTMGADFVDYLIADRFIIPPDQQQYYTEKVVRMPDCYQPNDSTRARLSAPTRGEAGLPESAFVFCCFNQTYKITPQIFDVWCKLLKAVPDSVLWMLASIPEAAANLLQEAQNRGISADRIIMAPLLSAGEHLARLQCADLFLDTLPYNAHTTCSDALWMGLPVVTCAGDTFPSRVAGSLLTAIGVPELITYNLDDYYQLALELATDKDRLAAIRNKIRDNRDTSPLFDSERFTRNLEQLYMQMVTAYSAGTAAS